MPPELEEMTPAQMLDAAMDGRLSPDGDVLPEDAPPADATDTEPQDAAPADADAPATSADDKPDTTDDEPPEGAPIASKSGTYTIPYEKLVQAREKASTLESENAALKAQLQELSARQQANLEQAKAAAQDRADAGQDATQADQNLQAAHDAIADGVDVSIFGDFSEDALAAGIAKLQANGRESLRAELQAELQATIARELGPIRQSRVQAETDAHYSSIYARHPDADELAQSEQFEQWQQGLPTFMREGVVKALSDGTAEQVIEVFDAFKVQSGIKPTKPQQAPAVPEVQRRVPNSLSEIAGEPHRDLVQQTLETADNPAALMDAMQSMTPEQLARVLDGV